jgi:hypothetical protein
MSNVGVYFHIPRTGGTFVNHAVGDWLSDEHWQIHYNYTENSSMLEAQQRMIPNLANRTQEQCDRLKILSGHSVNSQSHHWIKGHRTPLYFTTIRDPIERVLSSYNYKRTKAIKLQDPIAFSHIAPVLDTGPRDALKNYNDYNTLFEYALDCTPEINLQSKWLVKSFFDYNYHTQKFETKSINELNVSLVTDNEQTFPYWMCVETVLDNSIIDNCIEQLWFLGDFVNLENDTKTICQHLGLTYNSVDKLQHNSSFLPRWTLDEVKQQSDYNHLVNLFANDYYLYEKAKAFRMEL